MDRGWHIVLVKLLIIVQAIGGRHGLIVVAQGKEGAWRRTIHLKIIAEFGLQLTQCEPLWVKPISIVITG